MQTAHTFSDVVDFDDVFLRQPAQLLRSCSPAFASRASCSISYAASFVAGWTEGRAQQRSANLKDSYRHCPAWFFSLEDNLCMRAQTCGLECMSSSAIHFPFLRARVLTHGLSSLPHISTFSFPPPRRGLCAFRIHFLKVFDRMWLHARVTQTARTDLLFILRAAQQLPLPTRKLHGLSRGGVHPCTLCVASVIWRTSFSM